MSENPLTSDELWEVAQAFWDHYGPVQCQLDPFDETYLAKIPELISNTIIKGQDYTVQFGKDVIIQPPMHKELNDKIEKVYPNSCVERSITYFSKIFCDITYTTGGISHTSQNVYIGSTPILVRSRYCNLFNVYDEKKIAQLKEDIYDYGGYFIINGTKRFIIGQERSSFNMAYVYLNNKKPRWPVYTEVRSSNILGTHSTTAKVGIDKTVSVLIPYIETPIPFVIVFRALGFITIDEILQCIVPNSDEASKFIDVLVSSFEDVSHISSQYLACEFIAKKGKKYTKNNETTEQVKMGKTTKNDFGNMMDDNTHIVTITLPIGNKKMNIAIGHQDMTSEEKGIASLLELTDVDKGLCKDNQIPFLTQDILNSISNKKIKEELEHLVVDEKSETTSYALHLLNTEFLPHLDTFRKKGLYLGYMIRKMLYVYLGLRKPEDRDHFGNKRTAFTGMLMYGQFYNCFRKMCNKLCRDFDTTTKKKSSVNITSYIKSDIITNGMVSAISDNKWGKTKTDGVSQAFEKFNYMAGLSSLRKIKTPMNAEGGKIDKPRMLNGTHWGIVCPAETPEGKSCGLIKNLSLEALVTCGTDHTPIYEILSSFEEIVSVDKVIDDRINISGMYCVLVNGNPVGYTLKHMYIVNLLKHYRRALLIEPDTSISFNDELKEVHIFTDAGRLCRPLLVVEDGKLLLDRKVIEDIRSGVWANDYETSLWYKLLVYGYIEIIDQAEAENLKISLYPSAIDGSQTHCEIHPSLINGAGASLIPYSNHNQSPRNAYQAAMGKQSIGIPSTNYLFHSKGKIHVLTYPQKSLMRTKASEMLGFDNLPSGQEAVVAVAPLQYNQEDSLILNQDSIDRGFACIETYIAYTTSEERDKNEKVEIPTPEECGIFKGSTSKLGECGFVKRGQKLVEGDILIGKTMKVTEIEYIEGNTKKKKKTQFPKKSCSVIYDSPLPAVVHRVRKFVSGKGYDTITVTIVQYRPPEIGDKMSARHGQKGTAGKLVRAYDMPFTSEGIAPDVLINPLAFPSRMTIGMLIEMISGKKVACGSRLNNVDVNLPFRLDDNCNDKTQQRYLDREVYVKKQLQIEYTEFHKNRDATPFQKVSIEEICDELKSLGYEGFGCETMIDGMSGLPLKCLVYTGVCYYQRLRHMVSDKIHSRAQGAKTLLTRQPTEGRKSKGGFRVGIMEKDNFFAHGASNVIKDRLFEQSDKYEIWICNICGLFALDIAGIAEQGIKSRRECKACQTIDVSVIPIPYATKLAIQELMSMGLGMRLYTQQVLDLIRMTSSNAPRETTKMLK